MRITVDTNILISATQWDNSVSHKLFLQLIEAEVEIFTTREILEEFSEVLARDFQYTPEEVNDIITIVSAVLTLIETSSTVDIVKGDPDDNAIIECAIDSHSQYLITYDKHLLQVKEYQGIKIITPEEARTLL